VIPPKQNAAFVAAMEDVLEVYRRPYDPKRPVVCMDEQPTQFLKETRKNLPVQPGQPERVDYEYERNGTAVSFMSTETLGGWRKVNIRERKTAMDWAHEMKALLDKGYPEAEQVVLVCDKWTGNSPPTKPASTSSASTRKVTWHKVLVLTVSLRLGKGPLDCPAPHSIHGCADGKCIIVVISERTGDPAQGKHAPFSPQARKPIFPSVISKVRAKEAGPVLSFDKEKWKIESSPTIFAAGGVKNRLVKRIIMWGS